jgi:molybdate transport system ATP-binding protein
VGLGDSEVILLEEFVIVALVEPDLLILDEPCQGLDAANRRRILELADRVGLETETNLIYVTHHREEIPRCVTHVLNLGDGKGSEIRQ